MLSAEVITAIQKGDQKASRLLFDLYFARFAAIAARYSKNAAQSDELLNHAFSVCCANVPHLRLNEDSDPEISIENLFITECIAFIKNIRSEYYVSSTVHPTSGNSTRNYNLFENNEVIDFNNLDTDVLIQGLQKMVPAQRLVYNLHVIDGFSLSEVAAKLETSEETIKSNLEKARFNFQKNIEKNLKSNTVL